MTDLTVDTQDEVAVVTLDRPQRRNALSSALMVAIAETMGRLDADTAVGAIVLTGRDPAFCAGWTSPSCRRPGTTCASTRRAARGHGCPRRSSAR